jgi:translation initiation factor IF-2
MDVRPPIVVILGHVDHGKTTLLDRLRKSNLASSEIGGITQSTRAFQVTIDNRQVTFIDTPGHAAFWGMRRRGQNLADIAILLVAADDGVMPQTEECINLLLESKTNFIVAVNKCDLPTADVTKVFTQLSGNGVFVEGFGGNIPVVQISAKTWKGIPELLEMINLLASLNPLQADPHGLLEVVVLESRLDPRKGPMTTVVVKNGTLTLGTLLFTDHEVGKVKALDVHIAGPSTPVEILGLTEVVPVGQIISSQKVERVSATTTKNPKSGIIKIILKTDVLGSLEAIVESLNPQIEVISRGTGDIIESDILTAAPIKALIVGFNVKASNSVVKLANIEKVNIKIFNIIYELLDYVDMVLQKTLNPHAHEKVLGEAEVLAEFKVDGTRILGCKCVSGQITKSDSLHVERDNEIIIDSRFKSIRLGKTDSQFVKSGQEFGGVLTSNVDFKVGDRIIAFQ